MQHYGYLIDLRGVSLDDQTTWLQAFPYGKYDHPLYGEITMDPDKASRMASQVKSNIRGQELDIDYDHKQRDGIAAGWVKDAEARTDGLYIRVDLTPKAAEHVKNREYRYFSPEYVDEWEDPRDKTKYKDVLLGGALTNRPFLKGILPLNLSEATLLETPKGDSVDPKLIRQFLGLSEDATDEDVEKKLKEGPPKPPEPKVEPVTPKLSEDVIKGLDPSIKRMLDEQAATLAEQSKQIANLAAANRLSEVSTRLSELEVPGKRAIAPAAAQKLRETIIKAPKVLGDEMLDALKEVVDGGIIDLTEHGGRTPGSSAQESDAEGKFLGEVDKVKQADPKMSYEDAVNFVASGDPHLYDEYRAAVDSVKNKEGN